MVDIDNLELMAIRLHGDICAEGKINTVVQPPHRASGRIDNQDANKPPENDVPGQGKSKLVANTKLHLLGGGSVIDSH